MKDSYAKKEVAEITTLSYRNVQFYTEQGVVVPEIEVAGGRGKFRRYSNRNLISFIIVGELALYGMTVGGIREIVSTMEKLYDFPFRSETKEKLPDEKILPYLSRRSFHLRIGKTKDKKHFIEIVLGSADSQDDSGLTMSLINIPPGKTLVCLKSSKDNFGATIDKNGNLIQKFDVDIFDKIVNESLLSFILIRVDLLIKEAIAKMA